MKLTDIKKIVELQGKIIKMEDRIMKDVARHNAMVINELRPMLDELHYNTIYQLGDMTYKRGRVFCQLQCEPYHLGIKAEGLATLRRIILENDDASVAREESGQDTAESE